MPYIWSLLLAADLPRAHCFVLAAYCAAMLATGPCLGQRVCRMCALALRTARHIKAGRDTGLRAQLEKELAGKLPLQGPLSLQVLPLLPVCSRPAAPHPSAALETPLCLRLLPPCSCLSIADSFAAVLLLLVTRSDSLFSCRQLLTPGLIGLSSSLV